MTDQQRKSRSVALFIPLDHVRLTQLRTIAREKGMRPTTLARMWIKEHLNAAR